MTDTIAAISPKPGPPAAKPAPDTVPGLENETLDEGQFWSTDEGPTFAEFLDIINPLQHIPLVSTLYRAITGDEIGTGPRVMGGMLFGGPIGALAAGITALFEEASGGDLGSHIAELFDGDAGDDRAALVAENKGNAPPPVQQAALSGADILNRIALNPAAALGVAQSAQPALMNANGAPPARAMNLPFTPTAAQRPEPATTARSATANPDAQRVQASLDRSRRQQADLLLAQWAAQQMAQQSRAPSAAINVKRQ